MCQGQGSLQGKTVCSLGAGVGQGIKTQICVGDSQGACRAGGKEPFMTENCSPDTSMTFKVFIAENVGEFGALLRVRRAEKHLLTSTGLAADQASCHPQRQRQAQAGLAYPRLLP